MAQGVTPLDVFLASLRRRLVQYGGAKAHGQIEIVIQNGVIVRVVERQSHTFTDFVQGIAPPPR